MTLMRFECTIAGALAEAVGRAERCCERGEWTVVVLCGDDASCADDTGCAEDECAETGREDEHDRGDRDEAREPDERSERSGG